MQVEVKEWKMEETKQVCAKTVSVVDADPLVLLRLRSKKKEKKKKKNLTTVLLIKFKSLIGKQKQREKIYRWWKMTDTVSKSSSLWSRSRFLLEFQNVNPVQN